MSVFLKFVFLSQKVYFLDLSDFSNTRFCNVRYLVGFTVKNFLSAKQQACFYRVA